MSKVPINTAKEAQANPLEFLASAMVMGSSGAIEHQEAQGQRSFVQSEVLPREINPADKLALEKAGVKFGDLVTGDPIFQHAELPKGWKKVPTDHAMWSELQDDKGRKRAAIFYKAAFYDRSAHMHVERRYSYITDYERQDAEVCNVRDFGKVIHSTEPIPYGERRWEAGDQARKLAKDWLDANFPDWQDASAYWD